MASKILFKDADRQDLKLRTAFEITVPREPSKPELKIRARYVYAPQGQGQVKQSEECMWHRFEFSNGWKDFIYGNKIGPFRQAAQGSLKYQLDTKSNTATQTLNLPLKDLYGSSITFEFPLFLDASAPQQDFHGKVIEIPDGETNGRPWKKGQDFTVTFDPAIAVGLLDKPQCEACSFSSTSTASGWNHMYGPFEENM